VIVKGLTPQSSVKQCGEGSDPAGKWASFGGYDPKRVI
jgi:hypothetical protein